MIRELPLLKEKNWSINLEDNLFKTQPEQLIAEAVEAISFTAPGYYVNLVTHQAAGHPEQGLIRQLQDAITNAGIGEVKLVYIDECGCGGFVTRAFRK